MSVSVTVGDTDAITEKLIRSVRARTNLAVPLVRNDVERALNRSQPARRTASGGLVGLAPSAEGVAPQRLSSARLQSIFARVVRDGDRIIGYVAAPRVYARRLELGFVGTDARGRRVSQGPRPFLRPALEANRERILSLLAAARR